MSGIEGGGGEKGGGMSGIDGWGGGGGGYGTQTPPFIRVALDRALPVTWKQLYLGTQHIFPKC